jgi:hypothetical protein
MEPRLPFVGMAREIERLSLAFGTGDPLLLLGPQGSGKTRLIKEALRSHKKVLYIAWEPTLHALLAAMARALIAARHLVFLRRAGVPSGPRRSGGMACGSNQYSPQRAPMDGGGKLTGADDVGWDCGRRLPYLPFLAANLSYARHGSFRRIAGRFQLGSTGQTVLESGEGAESSYRSPSGTPNNCSKRPPTISNCATWT